MSTTVSEFIWQPKGDYLQCRVQDFMNKHGIKDWQELIKRSTDDVEWFWKSAVDYMGFQWHKPYTTLLDQSEGFPFAKWFVGGELNIAQNCLDFHQETGRKLGCRESVGKDHLAMIWEGESGESRTLTYGELNEMSGKVAALLTSLGIKSGEAVGIYMPMVPEVVAVLFGCLKVGAVAVPVFSGYGARALTTRLEDSKARILFTADGGKRKGKLIQIKADADEAAAELPLLEHVIVLKHCHSEVKWTAGRDKWWHECVSSLAPVETQAALPAEHPSMYLYTSGTTGRPKGTVHTHAGALAQIAKEHAFAFDVKPTDVFFWVT
ncbi:MAG TPA: AMP-binding protein, partial [Chroococcales cyanobacterium]